MAEREALRKVEEEKELLQMEGSRHRVVLSRAKDALREERGRAAKAEAAKAEAEA